MKLKLGACIACVWWVATAMAGTSTLPPGAVLVEPEHWNQPAGRAESDAAIVLHTLARDGSAAAIARLETWSDPARFELAAALVIETLQAQPSSSPASTSTIEEFLTALERAPIRLYQRHEETAADWFLPVFDIPARAASARRLLAFALDRDALVVRLQRDPRQALDDAKDSSQLLAASLERVSPAVVDRIAALALADDITLPSAAWAALARRKPEAAILLATLQHADALDVLPLIEALPPKLTPTVALDWLQQAARMPDYASSAVLGLGTLASRSPAAEAELAKHLGDPLTGASAAAALARLALPNRVERVDALLSKASTSEVVTHLALALRLEGSSAAMHRLQRLESDPRLSAAAKAELQR